VTSDREGMGSEDLENGCGRSHEDVPGGHKAPGEGKTNLRPHIVITDNDNHDEC
jgi:hypothetical protein